MFETALELPEEEQNAFLAQACVGQPLLLAELRSLLKSDHQAEANGFMLEPAIQVQARHDSLIPTENQSGQKLGRYRLLKLLGEGGMGEVYLAQDDELSRQVAIKLIRGNFRTGEVLRRFNNERLILAHLNHANIAGLLDAGTTHEGVPFFVMEYVEGQPLDCYANEHQLSVTDRLKLFRAVCHAVHYAHQNLIIHRDLKPGNILVSNDGEPKLLDFGIAKLLAADEFGAMNQTATLLQVMTPEYASPEQVKGETVTTATDVYSLGVVLYELLTGQRPHKFESRQPADIVQAICTKEPEKPSEAVRRGEREKWQKGASIPAGDENSFSQSRHRPVPPSHLSGDLDNIVLKALRKEPQRRYASVEQFSEDLRRHLEGLPVAARKDTFSYRAAKFIGRHKIGVAAAAGLLLMLLAGIVTTAWEARVARAQEAKTARRFNEVRKLAHSVLFDYHDGIANLSGSTPVRERLVKDALQYLDSLAQESGDDVSLQLELATAYIKVGDVQGRPYRSNLGQTDGALASYRKALAILEPLSASDPSNFEMRRAFASACERIGTVQSRKGDLAEAFEKTKQALAIREALLAADPANVNYRREVADSYIYFGDALTVRCPSGDSLDCQRKALQSQRKALEIRLALASENPSDSQFRSDIAQAHTRIGFRLKELAIGPAEKEYLHQSMESQQQSLAIRKDLAAANHDNAFDRRNLADQFMLHSDSQVQNGDVSGSLAGYRQALSTFKELAAADPSNAEARLDVSFALTKLGDAEAKLGNLTAAQKDYHAALPTLERLLVDDPTDLEVMGAKEAVYVALGDLSEKMADLAGAVENYGKVVALFEWSETVQSHRRWPQERAVYYARLGELYAKSAAQALAGQRAEKWRAASACYRKSLNIWREIRGQGSLSEAESRRADEVARELAVSDMAQLAH